MFLYGSEITLTDSDNEEYKVKIGGVLENYLYHYIYMSPKLYEKIYGKEYETNILYIKTSEISEEEENRLNEELLNNSKISSLTSTSYLKNLMERTLNALNKVVYVLIVSARTSSICSTL